MDLARFFRIFQTKHLTANFKETLPNIIELCSKSFNFKQNIKNIGKDIYFNRKKIVCPS